MVVPDYGPLLKSYRDEIKYLRNKNESLQEDYEEIHRLLAEFAKLYWKILPVLAKKYHLRDGGAE